jgi:hypothetical protein
MVSAGGNHHTLGGRKAALSTHRKFATCYVTASRATKNRPEANNQCDLPDYLTFKRQWGMFFSPINMRLGVEMPIP